MNTRVRRFALAALAFVVGSVSVRAAEEDVGVKLTISSPCAEYHMGEPIYVDLLTRCDRPTDFRVYRSDVIIDYDFTVTMPDGRPSPLTRYGQWCKGGGAILGVASFGLERPTTVRASIFLNHRFDMSFVGTYEVTAKQALHRTEGKGPNVVITSNTLKIKIRQPATRPAPEQSDPTSRPTTRPSQ